MALDAAAAGRWANLEQRRALASAGPCVMGIDEAGRGPVLGPMVYAAVVCPQTYTDALATQPYADSKTLTEAQREALHAQLLADEQLGAVSQSLSARLISGAMLARAKVSLNELAARATQDLIQAVLDAGLDLHKVFVDTVGDPDRYRDKLQRAFPSLEFTVCPKADALYPVVSAASIVAKVTRDRAIAAAQHDLQQQQQQQQQQQGASGCCGADPRPVALGTGYPGDPATQAWLSAAMDRVFGFPCLVRFAWDTASRLLEEGAARVTWEQDAGGGSGSEAGAPRAQQSTLAAFMAGGDASSESSGAGRHVFFRLRRLQRVKAF